MERRAFKTALGEVWFWGAAEAFEGSKPLVVAIHGAFAAHRPRFADLEAVLPVSVVSGWMPGQGQPRLSDTSVESFAAAYSAAVAQLSRGRPVVVCGESAGALVALAMGAERVIALDPPLRTEKLWPLIPFFRERLAADPSQTEFLWSVFGVSADELEPRDYRYLLDRPAHVIIGDAPLYPEGTLPDGAPSLVDEPERALMRSMPNIRLTVAPGAGHVIPGNAPGVFVQAVREALFQPATVR